MRGNIYITCCPSENLAARSLKLSLQFGLCYTILLGSSVNFHQSSPTYQQTNFRCNFIFKNIVKD